MGPVIASPGFAVHHHPAPHRAGRVVATVAGGLAALVALALVVAGAALIWANGTQRGTDGYYASDTVILRSPTAAITGEELRLGDLRDNGSDWLVRQLDARVRINATRPDGGTVFVGIARQADLDRYLAGTIHDRVDRIESGSVVMGRPLSGTATDAPPPEAQRFWVAQASGTGKQTAQWKPTEGRWAAVVMNADGKAGVLADVSVAAKTGLLLPIGLGVGGAGLLLALAAAGLMIYGLTGNRANPAHPAAAFALPPVAGDEHHAGHAAAPGSAAAVAVTKEHSPPEPSDTAVAAPYPVQVEAHLDEPLSRWLWLVKWLLAIPHAIVLVFLWVAFVVLTIAALLTVAFTGRYPRHIFDFNVGVLQWQWRVTYYATSAIGTDRYPPFTLGHADYPATLVIPYPEELSRGKALLKFWLLAIPHYLVLSVLFGGWGSATGDGAAAGAPGLVLILVVIAGVTLAATGRYPREIFTLLVGINRWLYRVIAYAAGMRDEYPPFRLGR